jgi:N-methylhydantoinase B
MRVISRSLRADSGGAGQYRGGLGQRIVLANDSGPPMTIFTVGTRTDFPAQGVCGGGPGALRRYLLNGKDIHAKGRYEMQPGDVLEILEAGGGGYGDPLKRDRARIEEDLRQGFVTREEAQLRYDYRPAAEHAA